MPTKSSAGSAKINQVHKDLKDLSQRFDGLAGQVSDLTTQVNGLIGLPAQVNSLTQRVDALSGLPAQVADLTKQVADLTKQVTETREDQQSFEKEQRDYFKKTWKLFDDQRRKDEEASQEYQMKIDKILTFVDQTAGQYSEFRLEKLSLTAGQDRLGVEQDRIYNEVKALKESDLEQNEAIEELENRVEALEAKQA